MEIFIEKNIAVKYTLLPENETLFRHITLAENTDFSAKSVVTENKNITIISEANGDNVSSKMEILALATNNSSISVQGIARVLKPFKHIFTRVDQTNILLGENTKVVGIPQLEIATNDVEGGHSCKIHRLHGDAIFYLQSHGLDEKHAESFLLNSHILSHLQNLPDELREEKCSIIHKKLSK